MTLAELISEVYLLTKRDDLVAETTSAVKAATLKFHQLDFWSRDIFETGIEFDIPGNTQSLDIYSIFSNYRALKYIRKYDDVGNTEGKFIRVLTPEEVLDEYGRTRVDVAYVAGRNLEIRSSTSLDKALLGFYANPIVTADDFSSWVASLHPFAIVYEAARVIFKTIGYDEESAAYEKLVGEQFVALRITGLTDVGY